MATQRIKIDTKGKNILALFTENIADLGFDAALSINKLTNRYSSDESRDYPDVDFTYGPPTGWSIREDAQSIYNLGQVLGPDQSVVSALIEKGKKIGREFFANLVNDAVQAENPFLASWWHMVSGLTIGPVDRVSQLYRPGFSRPPLPGVRGRWAQLPLSEMLEQNLLLPPADVRLNISSTNDDDERIESRSQSL